MSASTNRATIRRLAAFSLEVAHHHQSKTGAICRAYEGVVSAEVRGVKDNEDYRLDKPGFLRLLSITQ